MPIEILMPALSPTMKEGNLAKWLKKEGDNVESGEVIAEIETDKATMEVEAVDEGKLGKILISEGTENVAVNQVIALLLEDGEDVKTLNSYKVAEAKPANDEKVAAVKQEVAVKKEEKAPVAAIAPAPKQIAPVAPQITTAISNANVIASPVAKKLAAQNNVNLSSIKGSGPKGRVVKDDVLNQLQNPSGGNNIVRNAEEYSVIPNSNVRKVIANRLLESKQTIPHFYLSVDCVLDNLLELRSQINSAASNDESGNPIYKVSVNDLVIKASALALRDVPDANAAWSDEAILRYNNVDISVAVAIDDGLITPIVRNADQKSILNISSEMKELIAKAKAGTLQLEEFQGGGFSISNLGMYGIKQFNAIVNPPQSCILAVGGGEKRVVVGKGDVTEIVNAMTVSISCDHRVVDGAVGANFLQKFKFYIENPAIMLL